MRIVGNPLGGPEKLKSSAYQKRKQKEKRNQRNHIEGRLVKEKMLTDSIIYKQKEETPLKLNCLHPLCDELGKLKK